MYTCFMAGFGLILDIFGMILILCQCQGRITSPPDGKILTLLNGSTEKITWSFDKDLPTVNLRVWYFTSSDGVFNDHRLGRIVDRDPPSKITSLLDVAIEGTGTLLLKNVNQTYDGKYKFLIDGEKSTVVVYIAKKPKVTLNCTGVVTLKEGENFSCLCRSEGGNPPANVTWYKDGVKISDVGTENQTLNLLNISEVDRGTYKCIATSYPHANYTDEKFIQFTVNTKQIEILNCSSLVTLNEGDDFTCLCRDEGGNSPFNVTWYKDGEIFYDVGTEMQTLNLQNVSSADRGTYKCVTASFPDKYYNDGKFIQLIQVIIYFKPTNTMITFTKNPAVINGSITITCASDGFPEPFYTIFHNGELVSDNNWHTVSHVKRKDGGTYNCVAANIFGSDLDSRYLKVIKLGPRPTMLSTSHSLSSTRVTNPAECNISVRTADPAESNYSETKWYIVVIVLAAIIIGILLPKIVLCSRRKFRNRKPERSSHEPPTSNVDSTYQELDVKKMNKEDNYQSLRVNAARNDGVNDGDSTYTELNKTRDVDSNYQYLT